MEVKRINGGEVSCLTAGSPETSVIFNNPDRRVALMTPAAIILPDITTSSFSCGWGAEEEDKASTEVSNLKSVSSSESSERDTMTKRPFNQDGMSL